MKLNELGFDYSNLTSCTITRKKFVLPFVGLILLLVFAPISIIFLILYLLEVPMEFNGVLTYAYEQEYQQFFQVFLLSFGGLTVLSLLFMIGIFVKPQPYIIMDKDTTNYEPFYYIHHKRRNQILYLTEKFALIYNTKYNSLHEETNPNAIQKMITEFIFWKEFETVTNYKIKTKNKKTVLKYKSESHGRFSTILSKTYSFSNEIQVVPMQVTEMIAYTSTGRNNIQAYNKYYFDNINRSQYFEMHPEIERKLRSLS